LENREFPFVTKFQSPVEMSELRQHWFYWIFLIYLATPKQMIGVVQLVVRDENEELLALADHRKGGLVAGYR